MSKPPSPLKATLRARRAGGNTTYVPPVKPQVTEFLHPNKETTSLKVQELADLRELPPSMPRNRDVLTAGEKRARKYEIETGIGRDGKIWQPLEPWTCPVNGGMQLYQKLMFATEPFRVDDFTGAKLTAVKWMRDVQLVGVDDDGQVLPLSDGKGKKYRSYPGAPCSDRLASVGRYLREHGRNLVLAALCNLGSGKRVRRGRGNVAVERGDGIEIAAQVVCKEANAIKAKRDDLHEFRFLSLSACRQIIRDLLIAEVIEEIRSPKPIRQNRSWRTLPRVISKSITATIDRLGRPIPPPLLEAA